MNELLHRARRVFREGAWGMLWWFRLELRRGQGLLTAGLFMILLLLVVGLVIQRHGLPGQTIRLIFWLSEVFILFQAIPRLALERRPEEWRWLYQLFSAEGELLGLWLYMVGLSVGGSLGLWLGASMLWSYAPALMISVVGSLPLSLALLLSAILAARAEASYALSAVLAFPLLLFPLLWVSARERPPLQPLLFLFLAETLLFFLLFPFVRHD
ncbi:MAG: hypothetical protein RMK19_08955 [Bacteroidia bacterium]|nr:hypothetical protein [Bacteroidia bacterium]MDW8016121.1 hypothetical protein [Bacteroidia bacterium]